jgi:gamma-glutamyltranspeptidase
LDLKTGRPATLARSGMVTCPHSLASAAGADVLRAGGSAIDAAIAASATLAVVYPHMTSLGGDAFWLIYDAKQRRVRYLSGGGKAARSATAQWFADRGLTEIPYRGTIPATLTVPGAVASWDEAHRQYGKLPLRRSLEAAIDAARHGFPVTTRLSRWIGLTAEELRKSPDAAAVFLADGAPKPGQILKNQNLARTLDAVASQGGRGFYGGEAAAAFARYARENGGFFDAEDFATQRAEWGEPISTRYGDLTIYQTPAPTQGFTILQMLKLLEPFGLRNMPFLGADAAHLMVQAKQLAYHDRDRWLADPRFAEVPMELLLSADYLDRRRALMDPHKALPWDLMPSHGSLTGDTVYVAAVDAEGNAASLIQSLYWGFGSAVMAGSTGVMLQNRGAYFSLDPASPNRLEPGKVPLHTLIASIGCRDDALAAVVGCMGADGQPQIQLQVYSALLDHGADIQQAIEAPRFLSGRFVLGEARDTLHIEARFADATIAELSRRGHPIQRWGRWNELAGHAHGITIDPLTGVRVGGSDPRSDGAAIGC